MNAESAAAMTESQLMFADAVAISIGRSPLRKEPTMEEWPYDRL
jgi:hypothetical protein